MQFLRFPSTIEVLYFNKTIYGILIASNYLKGIMSPDRGPDNASKLLISDNGLMFQLLPIRQTKPYGSIGMAIDRSSPIRGLTR